MLDRYTSGSVSRISPEAPVPVLKKLMNMLSWAVRATLPQMSHLSVPKLPSAVLSATIMKRKNYSHFEKVGFHLPALSLIQTGRRHSSIDLLPG